MNVKSYLQLVCIVCFLFCACKKQDEGDSRCYLPSSSKYIASERAVKEEIRIFTINGEVFDKTLIDQFKSRYPLNFVPVGTTTPNNDTITVDGANLVHLRGDTSVYSINCFGTDLVFARRDTQSFTAGFPDDIKFMLSMEKLIFDFDYYIHSDAYATSTGYMYLVKYWAAGHYTFQDQKIRAYSTALYMRYQLGSTYVNSTGYGAGKLRSDPQPLNSPNDTMVVQQAYVDYSAAQ